MKPPILEFAHGWLLLYERDWVAVTIEMDADGTTDNCMLAMKSLDLRCPKNLRLQDAVVPTNVPAVIASYCSKCNHRITVTGRA